MTGGLHDDQLVSRAQDGEEAAFAALLRRHGAAAHRVAYLITRSAAAADDALQDGLVKAWYALDRFRAGRPFRQWFVTIVANEARNQRRSDRRRERLRLRAELPGEGGDPADRAVIAGEKAELIHHLDALPDKLRAAVTLRHLAGLSEKEAAAALGVRPGTIKSRVSRGIGLLRDAMGEGWE